MANPPDDWLEHVDGGKTSPIRPPPSDPDAEAAILSAILCGHSQVTDVLPIVRPADMFLASNRFVLSAMAWLQASGHAIDVVTVRGRLDDEGRLQDVGGVKGLTELLDVPSIANVEEYSRRVADKARQRRAIETFRKLSAQGYVAESLPDLLTQARVDLESLGASTESVFNVSGVVDVFAPIPPIAWVVKDMCLGPGRPTLLAGYGYSGKTILAQTLALCVASGARFLGQFFCSRGRVLHLDYEQGRFATNRRYQRLAFALGVSVDDLEDNLQVAYFPRLYLTSPSAEDAIAQACDGVALCVIDSFRAACPGVDENASEVRTFLDLLTRVSERTGTSFVVLHHAGKGRVDGDKRETARGSSAIFDACGTVIRLSASGAFEPVTVELVKTSAAATGKPASTFVVKLEDVADDDANNMQAGLRVVYQTKEQASPPTSPKTQVLDVAADVLEIVAANPGCSGRFIRGLYRGKHPKLVLAAIDHLERAGSISKDRRTGRGGGDAWTVAEPEPKEG